MCHGESDTWAENRVAKIMPRKLMSSAVGPHFACVPCSLAKWALGCLKKLQGQSPTVVALASLTFSSCLKLAPALALDPSDLRPVRPNLRSVFCQAAHSLLASGSHFCPPKTLPKYSATTTYGLGAGKSKLAFNGIVENSEVQMRIDAQCPTSSKATVPSLWVVTPLGGTYQISCI